MLGVSSSLERYAPRRLLKKWLLTAKWLLGVLVG